MFEKLPHAAPDKIVALMEAYRADPRETKLDLGVGVYRNAEGVTPVMGAIKTAEHRLWEAQTSKSYVGMRGDLDYVDAMRALLLGDAVPAARVIGAQTPGGTGAVRQLIEIFAKANPEGRIWASDPTWPNHPAIAKAVGVEMLHYRYLRDDVPMVDFDGMMDALQEARAGDAILLHGCCHNPTGANLTLDQWQTLTDFVIARGLLPFIDMAYQGFGDGLDADAEGVRLMAGKVPEMVIAASCSKNFGVYRDRVGAMFAITDAGALMGAAMGAANRLAYSFPPDHGAKAVQMVLADAQLRANWQDELETMRLGMLDLRKGLAEALRVETNSDRFDFVADHRGMFSRLGLTAEQVEALRADHGIYMTSDSRVNIAGLNSAMLTPLARAVAGVI